MDELEILRVKLDELSIIILKTLQNILLERKYLDANLQDGYINMAKARYLMRGQKIGIHQVNSANLGATLKISSFLDVEEGIKYLNYKLNEDSSQQKSVNLKFRSVNAEDQPIDEISVDEDNCKANDSETVKEKSGCYSNDPLKWFGVLVPESLRTCQSRFKQSVCTAIKLASLQNKLRKLQKEYKKLKVEKTSLDSPNFSKDAIYKSSDLNDNLVQC